MTTNKGEWRHFERKPRHIIVLTLRFLLLGLSPRQSIGSFLPLSFLWLIGGRGGLNNNVCCPSHEKEREPFSVTSFRAKWSSKHQTTNSPIIKCRDEISQPWTESCDIRLSKHCHFTLILFRVMSTRSHEKGKRAGSITDSQSSTVTGVDHTTQTWQADTFSLSLCYIIVVKKEIRRSITTLSNLCTKSSDLWKEKGMVSVPEITESPFCEWWRIGVWWGEG